MSNTLQVNVSARKSGAEEWWEGSVSLPGLKATKLIRKSDESSRFPSRFPSRAAVTGAARNVAKSLGFSDVSFGPQAAPVKQAAKKAVKAPRPAGKSSSTQTNS